MPSCCEPQLFSQQKQLHTRRCNAYGSIAFARFILPRVQDLQLVWQATVTRAPVAITVAKLGALPGIVCSLDDEGVLSACYQGTDPPTSAVVAAETKEVDYDQINQEHRKLLQVGACRA